MPIQTLDVIWIRDEDINPPGPKMVVCVEPFLGLFLRVNSNGWRDGSLAITKKMHTFLKHDSFIECGDPYELDEFIINAALKARGVIGQIDRTLRNEICAMVRATSSISKADKNAVCAALEKA